MMIKPVTAARLHESSVVWLAHQHVLQIMCPNILPSILGQICHRSEAVAEARDLVVIGPTPFDSAFVTGVGREVRTHN